MNNNYTFIDFKKHTSILGTLLFALVCSISNINAQTAWNDPGTTVLIDGTTPAYVNALLEVDGRPAIAFCDPNNNYSIKYQRATDSKGTSWGSSIVADGTPADFPGYNGVDMAIVNGNPAVVNSLFLSKDINFTRASNTTGDFWNSTVTVVSAASANIIQEFDLEVVNGNPAIVYYDSDGKDLYFVRATDANGTGWGTPVSVTSTGDIGNYPSLSMVNGRPAISYYDETNGDLMYIRANDTGGGSWGTPITVFSSANSGLHTSLTIVNGNPAIAFSDFTNKRMIYIRATDNNGAAWGSPVLVTSHYAEQSELLIVDGQPAIAYYTGFGDQDLRYVYSQNANGTSWNAHEVLDDGSAAVGNVLSMAIIDGNPAISYQDYTNSDLKYIRASVANGILPVELTSFKAELMKEGVELTWQTASEENNDGFEIQRSTDRRNWKILDFVEGYGTTSDKQDYNYTDTEATDGISYYRLKQIDYDGDFEYSKVEVITVKGLNEAATKIYPTMVQNDLNVEGGQGEIMIYNTLGQPVGSAIQHDLYTRISLSHLPKGQYFLSIQNGNAVSTSSFVKTE